MPRGENAEGRKMPNGGTAAQHLQPYRRPHAHTPTRHTPHAHTNVVNILIGGLDYLLPAAARDKLGAPPFLAAASHPGDA